MSDQKRHRSPAFRRTVACAVVVFVLCLLAVVVWVVHFVSSRNDVVVRTLQVKDLSHASNVRWMKPHSQGIDFDIVSVTNATGEVSYQVQVGPVSVGMDGDPVQLELEQEGPVARACVRGRINDTNEFPVMLDTGCSPLFVVRPAAVLEGAVPFYSLPGPRVMGVCCVERLSLGAVTFSNIFGECHNFFTVYEQRGRRIWTDRSIHLGLPLLRVFATVRMDWASQTVLLSQKPFQPDQESAWVVFPLAIRGEQLFADFPIGHSTLSVILDTGAFCGLCMPTELWSKLKHNWQVTQSTSRKVSYYPARVEVEKETFHVVRSLHLGELNITNAPVHVPDKGGLLLMGTEIFRNRTMVLDFRRMTLWISRQTGRADLVSGSAAAEP